MPHPPTRSFNKAWIVSLSFIVLLWLIHSLAVFNSLNLWDLGIHPKTINGLQGVLLAPLIHGDWEHLATNTPALVILITALYYGYPQTATRAMVLIWLVSGLIAWLFARSGTVHYGASGITHGLMFFLFTIGLLRRDRLSIALSMVIFFLYGSMVWSILPNKPNISFEMHLSGAAVGVVIAFLFRKIDIPFPVKHYDWENEEEIDAIADTEEIDNKSTDSDDHIGNNWIINEDLKKEKESPKS